MNNLEDGFLLILLEKMKQLTSEEFSEMNKKALEQEKNMTHRFFEDVFFDDETSYVTTITMTMSNDHSYCISPCPDTVTGEMLEGISLNKLVESSEIIQTSEHCFIPEEFPAVQIKSKELPSSNGIAA